MLGFLPFVGMKISNELNVACCSRAFLATLIRSIFPFVSLGDEKWQLFSLCSNSSFHSFVFKFQAFERSLFVNHLDFPNSIVAPKRNLEQSVFFFFFTFFSLSLFLSFSLFLSLALCVFVCVCVCVSVLFLFSQFCFSLSFSPYLLLPSFRFSFPLSSVYFSIFLFSNLMIKITS